MKNFLFILLIACAGCSTVKTNDDQAGVRLLKDIETLSSDAFEGRKTGTKGAEMARNYIISRFNEIGLKPVPGTNSFLKEFTFKRRNATADITGTNVIGYIPGKSDNVIVVSAHYDHLGVVGDKIFNGADDNASGTAALIKFAEYFLKNKPNFSIIIAAFDAEEMGLQGAHAFLKEPPVALDKIKFNINMDMIAHNDKGELYAVGTFKYPALKPYLTSSNPNLKIMFGHDDPKMGQDDWTNQSDQGAFNRLNIPFIYFGVEDHKDYHKETDEFQNINKTFYVDAANAILQAIINIDKALGIDKLSLKSQLIMEKQ